MSNISANEVLEPVMVYQLLLFVGSALITVGVLILREKERFLKIVAGDSKFWILSTSIIISLIYSTGLHYVYGPQRTIEPHFYFSRRNADHKDVFSGKWALVDSPVSMLDDEVWKWTSFSSDAGYYLRQSASVSDSIAPFRYRFLPTAIVGVLSASSSMDATIIFLLLNVSSVLLATLLFVFYLQQSLKFGQLVSLIGGILFVTSVSVTRTLPFPMVDPLSLLFSVLIFMAVAERNILLFLFSAFWGVATKEILVFASPLWLINVPPTGNSRQLLRSLFPALIPIAAFVLIRVSLGGAPIEVNYGFDPLRGEWPAYGRRLINGGLPRLTALTGLSFMLLWLGILNLGKNRFLTRSAIVIPLIISATILLSSGVTRVLGVLAPVVIPLFLLSLVELEKAKSLED